VTRLQLLFFNFSSGIARASSKKWGTGVGDEESDAELAIRPSKGLEPYYLMPRTHTLSKGIYHGLGTGTNGTVVTVDRNVCAPFDSDPIQEPTADVEIHCPSKY
jgi:hypothetical protein